MSNRNSAIKRRRFLDVDELDPQLRQINHIFDTEYRNDNLSFGLFCAGHQFRQLLAGGKEAKSEFKAASAAIRASLRREFISWLERAEHLDVNLSDLGRLFVARGTPEEVGLLVVRLALTDLAKHFHIRVNKC